MINVSGISESRVAPVEAAQTLAQILKVQDKEIYVLPAEDHVFLKYEAKNHDELLTRLKALKALRTGESAIIIAPVSAVMKRITPHQSFEENAVQLHLGQEVDIESVKSALNRMGYERMGIVDSQGQYSLRGGIIDIFTPDGENPYRIELFDTEIDSIRTFDIDTQRSIENLKIVEIYPAKQILLEKDRFQEAAARLHKEYSAAATRLEKKSPETAEKLRKRRDELCEYIQQSVNMQGIQRRFSGHVGERTGGA